MKGLGNILACQILSTYLDNFGYIEHSQHSQHSQDAVLRSCRSCFCAPPWIHQRSIGPWQFQWPTRPKGPTISWKHRKQIGIVVRHRAPGRETPLNNAVPNGAATWRWQVVTGLMIGGVRCGCDMESQSAPKGSQTREISEILQTQKINSQLSNSIGLVSVPFAKRAWAQLKHHKLWI